MYINDFEAWKFQNACRCHGNRKNTQFNTKMNNNHIFSDFWKVSSNSEHHSKPTMNINSQHHKLLGNQISPKSEDLFIWGPFCTLVTMATVAILIFSTLQKLPHTRVDIPTKWIILWLPNH
jgi:hypothetical protein